MFKASSELPRLLDRDRLAGLAISRADLFHGSHDIHAISDLAKDHVLSIQPSSLLGADEELRPVGVGSSVGHRQDSGASVLQLEVLIGKLGSVDALSSGSVPSSEVTPLAHELGNDAVELGSTVTKALLAGAQSSEVLHSLRDHVITELHHNSTGIFASNGDIEENVDNHCSKGVSNTQI